MCTATTSSPQRHTVKGLTLHLSHLQNFQSYLPHMQLTLLPSQAWRSDIHTTAREIRSTPCFFFPQRQPKIQSAFKSLLFQMTFLSLKKKATQALHSNNKTELILIKTLNVKRSKDRTRFKNAVHFSCTISLVSKYTRWFGNKRLAPLLYTSETVIKAASRFCWRILFYSKIFCKPVTFKKQVTQTQVLITQDQQ